MNCHAPAARWLLSTGAALGLALGCTTNPLDPDGRADPAIDRITPEDQRNIDTANQEQNDRIDATEATLRELYPVAAVDVRLSADVVTAMFGSANPTRTADTGRKQTGSDYVSAEQAMRMMSTSGGGGGSAANTTYNPTGAAAGTQVFTDSSSVEEAINALRWASQIQITQANTSWQGSPANHVQAALEDLDDKVNHGAMGAGTNPLVSATDDFRTIAEATDVREAINALRFIQLRVGSGFIEQFALPNGYVTEAVNTLDERTASLEAFRTAIASGNTTVTTATGVIYNNANQPQFIEQARKTDAAYSLPLEGQSLQSVVDELTLIIRNYTYADNTRVDLARAPLSTTRWAPGSALRGGAYALATGTDGHHTLDQVLERVNAELTDLDARVGGGGSSGGANAFGVPYDSATADASVRTFSTTNNVGDALGALRHATNITFAVNATLSAAGFPTASNTVQTAIASAYTLNRDAINQLRTDLGSGTSAVVTSIAGSLFNNTSFQSQLTAYINNTSSGGGGGNTDAVALAGSLNGMFGASATDVTDALTNIDQRLDSLAAMQATLTSIQNVTDTTFRNALRTFLTTDATFLSSLVSTTTVVNAINGGGGGGTPTILGLTTIAGGTNGQIQRSGLTGIRGAAEHCRTTTFGTATYPTAHMCTTSEVVAGLSGATTGLLDSLSPTALPNGFWVWDHTGIEAVATGSDRSTALARDGDHRRTNCGDFLYSSGDVADGWQGWVEMYTHKAGHLTGYAPKFVQDASCGLARQILCCK